MAAGEKKIENNLKWKKKKKKTKTKKDIKNAHK